MTQSQIYVTISVIILAIVAALAVFVVKKGRQSGLSKFAALSFIFLIAGILFGDRREVGYTLIGIGVLFAIVDMIIKFRSNKYN